MRSASRCGRSSRATKPAGGEPGSLARVELELGSRSKPIRARVTRHSDHLLATADWAGAEVARRAGRREPFDEAPYIGDALDRGGQDRMLATAMIASPSSSSAGRTSPRRATDRPWRGSSSSPTLARSREAAADRVVAVLGGAIEMRGVAHLALTGGSTRGRALPCARWSPARRAAVDWSRVEAWWGDDRLVGRVRRPVQRPRRRARRSWRRRRDWASTPGRIHPFPIETRSAQGLGPAWVAATLRRAAGRAPARGYGRATGLRPHPAGHGRRRAHPLRLPRQCRPRPVGGHGPRRARADPHRAARPERDAPHAPGDRGAACPGHVPGRRQGRPRGGGPRGPARPRSPACPDRPGRQRDLDPRPAPRRPSWPGGRARRSIRAHAP